MKRKVFHFQSSFDIRLFCFDTDPNGKLLPTKPKLIALLKSSIAFRLISNRLLGDSLFALTEEHCNPLQGNYRVELLHREIPVVITGNEFT